MTLALAGTGNGGISAPASPPWNAGAEIARSGRSEAVAVGAPLPLPERVGHRRRRHQPPRVALPRFEQHLIGQALLDHPAGGINERTAGRVARQTGAGELHFTAAEAVASRARFTRDGIYMGGALHPPETIQSVTTAARVRDIIAAVG